MNIYFGKCIVMEYQTFSLVCIVHVVMIQIYQTNDCCAYSEAHNVCDAEVGMGYKSNSIESGQLCKVKIYVFFSWLIRIYVKSYSFDTSPTK